MLRGVVALFAIMVASVGSAAAQSWTEFKPEGAGYSIEMPGEWTLKSELVRTTAGPMRVHTATVRANRKAYLAIYSRYPDAGIVPAAQILDGARDGAVSNLKGKLRKEDAILIGDLPAREFVVDAPNGFVAVSRIVLIGETLVQALAAGPVTVLAEPQTRRFLESLKVSKP